MNIVKTKKLVSYSLFVVLVAMLITGYGITKYQLIEKLSFGILQKSEAFYLHSKISTLLVILTAVHVAISMRLFRKK